MNTITLKASILLGTWALIFAPTPLRAETLPASDAQFAAELGGIERTIRPQAQAAKANWWNPADWLKDPVPTRDYSVADLQGDRSGQSVVQDDADLYFIDQGHVFKKDLSSGKTVFLDGSSRVRSILLYKGILVALRETGKIYIRNPKAEWVDIGNSTERILATDTDLVALTDEGELWVYKGEPGSVDITWTLIPIVTPAGDTTGTSFVMIPLFNGHQVAFFDSGIKNVKSIAPSEASEAKDIRIQAEDGSVTNYSAMKIKRR